jgi:hypothetical protein
MSVAVDISSNEVFRVRGRSNEMKSTMNLNGREEEEE